MNYKNVQLKKDIIKYFIKLLLLVIFIIVLNKDSIAQNLLSGPECVSFDAARNRYLVSCYTSGNIVQIDSNGVQSYLMTGFGHVLSNTIRGNIFYFSTVHNIRGYDVSFATPQQVMSISVPGSIQLDGMVIDTAGNLYVIDYDYSGTNDKIFKINLTTQALSTFVPPGQGLGSPQDIEYDKENNRLIVANWFTACPIQAVNLSDSTITNLVASSIGNFDGVARDTSGNYYFSSWGTNSVHKYDKNFIDPPIVVKSGLNGPANISYNPKGNLIVVPNFNTNSIIFVPLSSSGIKKIGSNVINDFKLYQNYPNPFNPSTVIKFQIKESGFVTLKVYDILGKEIATLVNEKLKTGIYETQFSANSVSNTQLSSGTYFYRIITDGYTETKKMLLIK
jgi:DNA-binding beta-propeller fold protein YncE